MKCEYQKERRERKVQKKIFEDVSRNLMKNINKHTQVQ